MSDLSAGLDLDVYRDSECTLNQGWSFCWQKGIFAGTVAKTGKNRQKLVKTGKNGKN